MDTCCLDDLNSDKDESYNNNNYYINDENSLNYR